MYSVRYSKDIDLLDIVWSGLFSPSDIDAYEAACFACWKNERFSDGFLLRITLDDGSPLPQQTLALLLKTFAGFPIAARTAMVTRGALSRLQIKRALMRPNLEIFEEAEKALTWLRGE